MFCDFCQFTMTCLRVRTGRIVSEKVCFGKRITYLQVYLLGLKESHMYLALCTVLYNTRVCFEFRNSKLITIHLFRSLAKFDKKRVIGRLEPSDHYSYINMLLLLHLWLAALVQRNDFIDILALAKTKQSGWLIQINQPRQFYFPSERSERICSRIIFIGVFPGLVDNFA